MCRVHAVYLIFSGPVHVWTRGILTHCADLTWCFIVPCNDSLPVLVEFIFERGITPFLTSIPDCACQEESLTEDI